MPINDKTSSPVQTFVLSKGTAHFGQRCYYYLSECQNYCSFISIQANSAYFRGYLSTEYFTDQNVLKKHKRRTMKIAIVALSLMFS